MPNRDNLLATIAAVHAAGLDAERRGALSRHGPWTFAQAEHRIGTLSNLRAAVAEKPQSTSAG